MHNMSIIINNPKSGGGGKDLLAYRVSNIANYDFENSSITSLNKYAFYYDANITNVSFANATSISEAAFHHCTSLISVNIPNATSISLDAFVRCTSLTTIDLPKVTSIGSSAFSNCLSLASITLGASSVCTLASTSAIPASSTHHITIYVPSALIDSYKAATNWSTLYNNGYITFSAITE